MSEINKLSYSSYSNKQLQGRLIVNLILLSWWYGSRYYCLWWWNKICPQNKPIIVMSITINWLTLLLFVMMNWYLPTNPIIVTPITINWVHVTIVYDDEIIYTHKPNSVFFLLPGDTTFLPLIFYFCRHYNGTFLNVDTTFLSLTNCLF